MKKFITPEGFKALDNYQYKAGEYSWLDYKINPFWLKISECLPIWMAPNLVTLIGFIFLISSYIFIMFYDLTIEGEIPSWLFIKAAIDIQIYQTLDAVDGKQARRTKSSSPLGQLFDHGCDSFSITFIILAISQAQLFSQNLVFLAFVSGQVLMFQSNWIEYHTHILNTAYGNFGVTEMEIISSGFCLVAGVFGQRIYKNQLSQILPTFIINLVPGFESTGSVANRFLSLTIGELNCYVIVSALAIIFVVTFIQNIIKIQSRKRMEAIYMFFPLVCILIMDYIWQNSIVYEQYAGFILFSFGLLHSSITSNLIICSLTKMKFQLFHPQIVLFGVISISLLLFEPYLTVYQWYVIFFITSFVNIVYILSFVNGVIQQITQHLGIYCFSLKKRPKKID